MRDVKVILHTASLEHDSSCSASSGVFQVGERGPGAEVPATAPPRRSEPVLLCHARYPGVALPGSAGQRGGPRDAGERRSATTTLPQRKLRALLSGSPRKFRGAHAGRSWLLGPGTGFLQLPRPQDTHQMPVERDC